MASAAARTIGSWLELAGRVQQVASAGSFDLHGIGRRGLRESSDGPASAQAALRTFGEPEASVRVVLYRDNHAWCPYCRKVWMQLEEKRIPYRVEKVSMNCYGDKSRAFLAKTPQGLLPAVELDGRFYKDSTAIMQLIEKSFPEKRRLMPASGLELDAAQRLLSLERDLFGAWLHWLRGEESSRARSSFERAMDATDAALAARGGPFFMGTELLLPDIAFVSTLDQIAASVLYYKGIRVKGGHWPHINAWFAAMDGVESYRASEGDFHTHAHDLPPQIGGCIASQMEEQRAIAAEIDGIAGSWSLPLPPLTAESLEPGRESPTDELEAAHALVHCHRGILKSTGVGEAADLLYRYVAAALIDAAEEPQKTPRRPVPECADPEAAAAALRWTRDRISVPRDMSFPAARKLRAYLNWAADAIDPRKGWHGVPLPVGNRRDTDPARFAVAGA
mmetsp:Transcript_74049/g.160176  ORF Transcript_74049/g.160176 Transcript_74049/m.160176 type:complete len:449 (-) Transcript_74049:142-1488(-)